MAMATTFRSIRSGSEYTALVSGAPPVGWTGNDIQYQRLEIYLKASPAEVQAEFFEGLADRPETLPFHQEQVEHKIYEFLNLGGRIKELLADAPINCLLTITEVLRNHPTRKVQSMFEPQTPLGDGASLVLSEDASICGRSTVSSFFDDDSLIASVDIESAKTLDKADVDVSVETSDFVMKPRLQRDRWPEAGESVTFTFEGRRKHDPVAAAPPLTVTLQLGSHTQTFTVPLRLPETTSLSAELVRALEDAAWLDSSEGQQAAAPYVGEFVATYNRQIVAHAPKEPQARQAGGQAASVPAETLFVRYIHPPLVEAIHTGLAVD